MWRDWAEAFERLPAHTKSVTIDLGGCSRDKGIELGVMDMMYRKIAKKAPGAAGGITGLLCGLMLSDFRGQWAKRDRDNTEQELNEMIKSRSVMQS